MTAEPKQTLADFTKTIQTMDDDMLVFVAAMRGMRPSNSPDGRAAAKVVKAEIKRRRLGGTLERFTALAKAESDRIADQSVTAHLPDGSQIITMPGATVTARWVKEENA